MIRALNTERYARLVQRFRRLLDGGPPQAAPTPEGEKPVPVMARKLLRKRTKTVLRKGRAAGPDSSDKKLHKLRIRCKRLRYACEFFRDLYGEPAQDFRKRVKELQDILGTNQDAVVARETLSSYAQELPGSDEEMDPLQRAVGELMARHARRSRNARKEFFKAWEKFDSKKVHKPLRDAADGLAQ
jgi:CHAD domain-containing protein